MEDASKIVRKVTEELATKYVAQMTDGVASDFAPGLIEYEGSTRLIVSVTVDEGRVSFWAHRESGGSWFNLEFRSLDDLVIAVRALLS